MAKRRSPLCSLLKVTKGRVIITDFEPIQQTERGGEGFTIDETFVEIEPDEEPEQPSRNIKKDVIEWLDIISTAVIAVVVIFCFIFRVATIDGNSMLNTLIGGDEQKGIVADKVIITNLAYTPEQGDIVVISRNVENSVETQSTSQGPIIKRVIAVGGQTVNLGEDGIVYVDGVPLDESDYIGEGTKTLPADVEFPISIPEGYIFVLGDNRPDSLDSRYMQIGENGLIDTRYVLGHAVFRIFPFNRIGRLDNK